MNRQEDGHTRKKYLVTLDLEHKVQAFANNGLKVPGSSLFRQIQNGLLRDLSEILPQYDIEAVPCSDLYDDLASLVHQSVTNSETLIVSSVPEMLEKCGGVHLHINRIVDCQGKMLGLGPRPGYSPIGHQFGEIGYHDQWPLLLVEDGSFSGGTVRTILEMARDRHVKFNLLVIGLLFEEAKEAIAGFAPNLKVKALKECSKNEYADWLPDYDFFPFIPNAGRVVGHVYNGNIVPVYFHNGITASMPYILPYGDPIGWASFPEDMQKVSAFSLNRIHDAMAIFEEMESLSKKKITFEDLLGTFPRAGFAVTRQTKDCPEIESRILDFLRDDAHFIA